MRVGFDVSPLHRPHPRGVERVVAGLVGALERRGRVEVVRLAPDGGDHSARWRQVELPRAAKRLGLAGIHSLFSAFPLRGAGRRVQTIHELPWLHGADENAGWRHRMWARLGPHRADRVMTATETTARDVRSYSGVDAARVRVAPWGLDASFLERAEDERDAAVLAAHGLIARRYVLCAGGGRAKKRTDAVVRGAVEHARRGGPSLAVVVTGPIEARVALDGGARLVGAVSDADLAALYRHAAATAILSRSEGFGLPVLEALASGTAVVVARGTAQAEVAGHVGISVDPDDAGSVAEGLARALAGGDGERARRVARAREHTWDRCAAIVEDVWSEFAK